MIKTTINMNLVNYQLLNRLMKKSRLKKTFIIKCALDNYLENIPQTVVIGHAVKYQPQGSQWHKFHIAFKETEYEQYYDYRKLYKLSFSLLIAHALIYFSKIYKHKNITTFITRNLSSYIIRKKTCTNGTVAWIHYWGLPDEFNLETIYCKT